MTTFETHDSPRPATESVPRILDNTVGILDDLLEARRQIFASLTDLATALLSSLTDAVRDAGSRTDPKKV